MPAGRKIFEHIDEFNKIVLDLANIEDHLKRNCPKNNRKKSTGYVKQNDQPSSSGYIYDDSEVMMVMSAEALLDLIMDSGCSSNMTPKLDTLFDFLECDVGSVLLGDNRECKIRVAGELNASVDEKDSFAQTFDIAGTPQQNGLAERMNKTLMEKVRCLLIQYGLPKTFWAEATCTAAYLINRSPSTVIEKKTPMKMWSGHQSDYEMLRIFGCVAYSQVKQGKLEPRAVRCVLLGYPEGVKGYRLYRLDGESPKIVTSRNVVFNESVMYKDTLKDSGAGNDKSVEELQVVGC
ncbi:retrotransposon protein, putative, ty1-copia subclass [Tanacetum coccineum]